MKKISTLSKLFLVSLILSFTAFTGNSQILLNEDFSGGVLPTGWTETSVSNDSWEYGTVVDQGSFSSTILDATGISGEYANIDFSDDPDTTSLITPRIGGVSALTAPRLTFEYFSQSNSSVHTPLNQLILDYWDGTAWVNITTIDSLTTLGWTKYDFNITSYIFSTDSVQFRFSAQEGGAALGGTGTSTFNQDLALDEVTIEETPTCLETTGIFASTVQDTSLTFSWTENNSATQWQIEWETTANYNMGTSNISIINTDTFAILNGLTASTEYTFRVRAICTVGDTSFWSFPISVFTACPSSFPTPFTEDFNSLALPNCWTQGAGNSEDWEFQITDGHIGNVGNQGPVPTASGGGLASVDDSSPHNTNTTLESPGIDVSALIAPRLTFYTISDNEGNVNGNVDFHVDIFDGANWNDSVFFSDTNSLNGTWEQIIVDLSTLTITGPIQVRFVVDENNGTLFDDDRAIDDVVVEETPLNDIGITDILRPSSGCGLSSSDSVEVVITNFGAAAQVNFDVGYTLDGVAILAETVTDTLGVGMTMNYTFTATANLSASGNYDIGAYTLLTTDSDSTSDSSSISVYNNPVVSSFPYSESFEAGAADWRVTGGLSTFELGAPINTIIDTASDGTQAWVTDLDGNYLSNEDGAVNSPCFDFTNVDNPYIEMDIWWDAETSWDGAVLQSSIDGGATWQKVGADGDPNNWFNDGTINGLSGIEPSQEGWTGSPGSNGWVTAEHALDGLSGISGVQLRVVFGSDGSVTDEGFAFDNVNIYNKVPYYPIATINTEDSTGVADSLNVNCLISGTVTGIDRRGGGYEFALIDLSSGVQEGITVFDFSDLTYYTNPSEGDSLEIYGTVSQFNGLTQFRPDSIVILQTGTATIATPIQVADLDETTESKLLELNDSFVLLDPSGSGSYNMDATNGIDTITIRIDSQSDIDDSLNITANALIAGDTICGLTGIGGQFDNSSPYDEGYQIFPSRYSDITICRLACTDPTALSSSNVSADSASLSWTSNGAATQWEISYGSTGFTAGTGTQVLANNNPFDLLNLSPNTAYDWYVRSICGVGDTSNWSDTSSFTTLVAQLPYYPVGTINGEDSTGVADSLNVACITSGTVTGVDRRGGGYEFALIDLSSGVQEGITVFDFNDLTNYTNPTEGDSLEVYGSVGQFNGLTQFRPDSIVVITLGTATVATPILVTDLDETTESKLVELNDNFVLLDPSGSFSYNMDATNGTDTITIRVDSDTDVDDSLSVITNSLVAGDTICGLVGIGGQFDNSSPFTEGYQVFPSRYSDLTICRLSVGIKDVETSKASFTISPNPTSGEFTIRTTGFNNASVRVLIRDISGRIISDEILTNANNRINKTMNLSENAKGLYFINIFDGDAVIHQKLILR